MSRDRDRLPSRRARGYPDAMIMAQITDTHIRPEGVLAYRRVDTAPYLSRAVEHLTRLRPRPDVVLATGDLVDAGTAEEYRRLHGLLAPLPMPVYLIPGNHDNRDALRAAFADVVRRHPQVERVVCGHLHRPIQARVGGTLASTAPSTAHQVALDLEDDHPLAFVMEPPACQLHVWRPDTGLVSHTSYIGDFDGPYLPSDGSKVVGSGLSPARATRRLP